MSTGTTDVHQTRTFGSVKYLGKQVPYAVGLLLLGIVMYVVDPENTHAALALMSVSVVLIGYVLYRQSTSKSIVTAPLDLNEADAKFCQLGSCAPGAEPASQ